MASEAVQVIVSAEDQASRKFAQIAANAEQSMKRVKDTTKATKSTAEFAGVIGNLMGGTAFGQFAGQLGQISEKVSQFSEVSVKGGAGALAFKGGLMAMAATLGYQVGAAISNAIFDFDQFNRQLEAAAQRIKEFDRQAAQLSQRRFAAAQADIELIRDPQQKQAAIENLTQSTQREIEGLTTRVAASQRAVDEWAAAWKVTGDRKGFEQQAQQQLERDKELLRVAQEQRQALQDQAMARERAAIAAQQQAEAAREERAREGYRGMLLDLDMEATLYLQGADAVTEYKMELLNLTEAEKQNLREFRARNAELKKDYDEKQKAIQQAEQAKATYASTMSSLERQRIEIDQGAEAARRFELAQQGMTQAMIDSVVAQEKKNAADRKAKQNAEDIKKLIEDEKEALRLRTIEVREGADAARIAALVAKGVSQKEAEALVAQSAALDDIEASKERIKQFAQGPGALTAVESRLLSRGSAVNPMLDVAREQLALQQRIAKATEDAAKQRGVNVRLVGGQN